MFFKSPFLGAFLFIMLILNQILMSKKHILSFLTSFIFSFQLIEADIEEVVVTGSLIKVLEDDSSPIEVITSEEYDQLNICLLYTSPSPRD